MISDSVVSSLLCFEDAMFFTTGGRTLRKCKGKGLLRRTLGYLLNYFMDDRRDSSGARFMVVVVSCAGFVRWVRRHCFYTPRENYFLMVDG